MNLRKDHCRCLQSKTTREQVKISGERHVGCKLRVSANPLAEGVLGCLLTTNSLRRGMRQGIITELHVSSSVRGGGGVFQKHKRLSATDISALASMKNVAKCDTWCELQNPVNHRVFERKLRPKPLGGGHVCLGVTHRVDPQTTHSSQGCAGWGRIMASRALRHGWPKKESPVT